MAWPKLSDWTIPEETARVARAAFPKGGSVMRWRDELGVLYDDQDGAALFATRGQPAESPGRLLLVLMLPCMDGLTDRQGADAVRGRIAWKEARGLAWTDPGFDYSGRSACRTRMIAADAGDQVLDRGLTRCQERGGLRARGPQRTDSTHVLAAMRPGNRLEGVGEAMADTLHSLLQVAPAWGRAPLPADWLVR